MERDTSCPICDAPAWIKLGVEAPDPTVGIAGGTYLEDFQCDEGHFISDLSGRQIESLEDRHYVSHFDAVEAAREAHHGW